ncbi:MAG: pentapeptide repeat-containing protein [Methanocorpusculum sp.]|uniref:pentapeptide repeat-containing protein n=1 Tax=Methanocorpusculum sp. TaxID=2058474 RepID=UPI002723D660|nr:pentapeptide repeat-containing protein [Methanocorpusculum sp.]MDO9522232.1 pentapeptide repeat-containing protein [Methanocorpusculum sp.]
MDEKPEGWNQELYEKLSSDFLIECVEYNRIGEWNDLYLEYLESEWNRLYPEKRGDPIDILELVDTFSGLIRPDFVKKDFREAISRGVRFTKERLDLTEVPELHLEGADFSVAHMEGAYFSEVRLEGAIFFEAHLEGAVFGLGHLEGAVFMRAHLERAVFTGILMERAKFMWAHMEGADFFGVHMDGAAMKEAQMEGANFQEAHLEGADFQMAQMERARLDNAHLNGADFKSSYLQGANLSWAIVNENTSFQNIRIDDATGSLLSRIVNCKNENGDSILCKLKKIWREKKGTDFSNVALGTCRIDTLTKTRIEKNIRVYRWNDWYKNHVFLQIIMRPFWFLTDYGSSTKRPIFAFILWNTIFSIIYFLWLGSDFQELMTLHLSPIWENIGGNIVIFLTDWMKSNLMIISLTDMATTKIEPLTLFFVFLHVFVGYFILAALIARFSIMFQNLSPNEK